MCFPSDFPFSLKVFTIFLAWQGPCKLSNRNGVHGVKAGRCIVAFMIFNFFVYKRLKTGLNWFGGHARMMHVLLSWNRITGIWIDPICCGGKLFRLKFRNVRAVSDM